MKGSSQEINRRRLILDASKFIFSISLSALLLSIMITFDTIDKDGASTNQNGIILNTCHPLTTLSLCVVIILLTNFYIVLKYLEGNAAIKEINEFSLFISVIYPAYQVLFFRATPYYIGTQKEIDSISQVSILFIKIVFLILLFNKVFIIMMDIANNYKIEKKQ